MPRLVIISDTHGLHNNVMIPPGDILIHCGDFTNDIGRKSLRDFLIWFEKHPHPKKLLVAGNHDGALSKYPDLARLMIKELAPSVIYLENSGCEINGIIFWGSPYTPTFFDWYFMANRGADIKRHWDMIPNGIDVLITHGPAYNILDLSGYDDGGDRHVGCKDLTETIKRIKPKLHVFGHIHHSYGAQKVDDIQYVNASVCDEGYRPVNQPFIYEYA